MSEMQDIKKQLGDNFAELKAAIDERDADIKAFGEARKETDEKIGRIDAAISAGEERYAELQASTDKIFAALDQMAIGGGKRGEAAEKQAAAARQFFARYEAPSEKIKPENVIPGDFGQGHIDAYAKYAESWITLLRKNGNFANLTPDIQANLRVGLDNQGGFLVPVEMEAIVRQRLFDTSPMRQIAQVQEIGSDKWEAPYMSDDAVSGGWVGEMDTRPETGTQDLGMMTIEAFEQYAMPKASQRALDDMILDLGNWIMRVTGNKMIRTENAAYVTGNGSKKPRGFVDYGTDSVTTTDADGRDWGKLQYVPIGAAGAFPTLTSGAADATALIDMIAALNQGYHAGATWAMSRLTAAVVRKLRDADGRYLVDFNGGAGLEGSAALFTLHGYPIAQLDDMPVVASDSFSIAFGNFGEGYMIVDRLGMRTIVDNITTKGQVKFYMTKRTGGDVQNFDAIKLAKFATS